MTPDAGGRITDPVPVDGGTMTPPSGIGRAPSPPTCGFSLRGAGMLVPSFPCGNVAEPGGLTTSGTCPAGAAPSAGPCTPGTGLLVEPDCANVGIPARTPAASRAQNHQGTTGRLSRTATLAPLR